MASITTKKIILITVYWLFITLLCLAAVDIVTPVKAGSLAPPRQVISITNGNIIDLAADTNYRLMMADGDEVNIPAMINSNVKVVVQKETAKTLPTPLPEETRFVDAIFVGVFQNDDMLARLNTLDKLTIYFSEEYRLVDLDYTLSIYHWENNKWVEVMANSLDIHTNAPGLYVLVER